MKSLNLKCAFVFAVGLAVVSLLGYELPAWAAFAPLSFGLTANLPGLSLVDEFKTAVQFALTGTTAETVLASVNIPGGLLGANGEIDVEYQASVTNGANDKTLTLKLGGTTVISQLVTAVTGVHGRALISLRNAANSQHFQKYTASDGAALTAAATAVGAVNMQNDTLLTISGTLEVGGELITLEKFRARFYKAA